jgi:putative ABC transport system permease protein
VHPERAPFGDNDDNGNTDAWLMRGNPVWGKAPASLLGHPSLFAALAMGAFLVVISTAASPLFLSASGSALVSSEIDNPTVTRFGAGITYTVTNVRLAKESPDGEGLLIDRRRQLFARLMRASPIINPVVEQAMGDELAVTGPGGEIPASGPLNGVLFSGTDVLSHVDIVAGAEGPGVWLPDYVAEPLDAGPGDQVELHLGDATVTVSVDGIYRALYAQPGTGYWRTWSEQLYIQCPDCSPPPQPILVDRAQLVSLSTQLGTPRARFALTAPVTSEPTTLDEARDLSLTAERLRDSMTSDRQLRTIFPCCGRLFFFLGHGTTTELLGAMTGVVGIVDQRLAAVEGPIHVLFVAALVISFGVVAAAGVFSFSSRSVDAGVLAVRGWGPGRMGVKAALESALPTVVGAVAGFLVATATIAWLGPAGVIEPSARSSALVGSLVAMVAVIAVVGTVTALAFASKHEPRAGLARVVMFLPWEILTLAGAYVMSRRLDAGGGVTGTTIERPASAAFLFPLLLALGVAIVAARLFALALMRRRGGDSSRVSAWYLTVRRLASSSRLATLFLVAASIALAVFVASRAMVSSLRTTVDAKAKVFVGSDVRLEIGPDTQVPPDLGFPATIATRSRQMGRFTDTDRQFDLVAIDPTTFGSAAYWNDAFSDRSVPELMDLLKDGSGDRLPVVMANRQGPIPVELEIQRQIVPIEVVAEASSVPGTSSDRPVFMVTEERLLAAFAGLPDPLNEAQTTREMWIRGPSDDVVAAASAAGVESYLTITADEVSDIPFIKAAIDTFLVLDVLGVVALILVLVVAIVYLQARQRSRIVSMALSERMGLQAGTMRRSLTLELAILLFGGLVVGAATGLIGATIVIPYLDPLPTIPPGPIAFVPWGVVVFAAAGLGIVALIGGWLANRAARDVLLGEVLGVAD